MQASSECPEGINHTSKTSVPSEEHQSFSCCINNPFVIDQGTPQVHHFFQHRHVMVLSFDSMGKKHVRLVFLKICYRDFFYREDDRAWGEAFVHSGTGLLILSI